MKNNKEIENKLEKLGNLLRSQPSVIKNGMQKIKHIEQPKQLKSAYFTRVLYKSGIGLAACLMIGVFLLVTTFWPTSITLADVQKSIENKTWILITYDDNKEEWVNLQERKHFLTYTTVGAYNFYAGMRDHNKGLWIAYHSNWGEQIHEETFEVRPYPQTPWEYAVSGWNDTGPSEFTNTIVEKSDDIIDEHPVIRFDTYSSGPLDLRVLTQQVWADPETHLPVRIRKYSSPDEFDTGDFSFPETGPSSIYDLGAPEDLEVVMDHGIIEPAVIEIKANAEKALNNLPQNMRIIEKDNSLIRIYHRIGNKLRIEYYGNISEDNRLLPIDFPETNDDIYQWAIDNLTRFVLKIYDGEYEYLTGIKDAPLVPDTYPSVEFKKRRSYIQNTLPIERQWPYTGNVGPIWIVEDEPDTPSGCVHMRYEGTGVRRDWYVDTEHDYICIKRIQFSQDKNSGEFINPSEIELTNLTQLSSGQWFAKTIGNKGNFQEKYDIKLLSDSEIEMLMGKNNENGFFDGIKVIKSEMDKGKKVRFWAK
ncbi:MAG: hypothetical protein JXA96_02010 [Sedimentisphaerales bacterium]|nr:hypothetical protein [Sedimentisphaerales bacterium]